MDTIRNIQRLPVSHKFKSMLRFYNAIMKAHDLQEAEEVSDIPIQALRVLSHMSHRDLCKPFILIDIERGMSRPACSIKYGLSEAIIRNIGYHSGHYVSYPNGS